MRSRLFSLLAVLSLLVFSATVGLWVAGHYRCVGFAWNRPDRLILLEAVKGDFQFWRSDANPSGDDPATGFFSMDVDQPLLLRPGIHRLYQGGVLVVTFPASPMAILFSLPPLMVLPRALRALRQGRRRGKDRCAGCGYDLRATPERCPECGRVVAGK
jgi:hypothetical protein